MAIFWLFVMAALVVSPMVMGENNNTGVLDKSKEVAATSAQTVSI